LGLRGTNWQETGVDSTIRSFRLLRKIAKSDSKLLHVCPSVRMKQIGSHSKDFHEFYYLRIFRKSVEKIEVTVKYDNNSG